MYLCMNVCMHVCMGKEGGGVPWYSHQHARLINMPVVGSWFQASFGPCPSGEVTYPAAWYSIISVKSLYRNDRVGHYANNKKQKKQIEPKHIHGLIQYKHLHQLIVYKI